MDLHNSPSRISLSSILPWLLGAAALVVSSCGNDAIDQPHVDPAAAAACPLTCRDLKNCRLQCDDTTCTNSCDAFATPEAKTAYDAAFACADANGCKGAQADACIQQHCAALVATCLPPIPALSPPRECSVTCGNLIACRSVCREDAVCQQACEAKALPVAKKTYDAAVACMQARGCKDFHDECARKYCGDELEKCQ